MHEGRKPRSESEKRGRNILMACAVMLLPFPTACAASDRAPAENASTVAGVVEPLGGDGAVFAIASRQDSEGVTEAQMDQIFLSNLNKHSVERLRVHTGKSLEERGVRFTPSDLSGDSIFVDAGGKRLAITRFRLFGFNHAAQIVGISGKEIIRIMCLIDKAKDVVVTRGPCNEKVREEFGVSLDPRN